MGGVQRPRRPDALRGEAAMDPVQAERFVTSCVEALQTWERTQGLMADAVALCEAALAAQSRSKELHLRPPHRVAVVTAAARTIGYPRPDSPTSVPARPAAAGT